MARARESGDWGIVQAIVALLVIGLFLFSVRPVLTPIVLFLLLLLVLSPYAGTRGHLLVTVAAAVLTLLWVFQTTGSLLAPFILALALAYILNPAVERLERRRIPRWLGIFLLTLPALTAIVLGLAFGVPALADQVEQVIQRAPALVDRVTRWLEAVHTRMLALNIPFVREETVLRRFWILDPERVVEVLQAQQQEIAQRIWQAALGIGRGLGAVLTAIGYVVLTPVLAFYLLRDYDRILAKLEKLIPRHKRTAWIEFLAEYDLLVSRYLRGQVLNALLVGVLTWILLWILRFPYAGLVGAVAGLFNLIPFLGLVVSLVPAVLIALVSGDVLGSLIKVILAFALVQALDSTVTGPRIVGGSVGLHPVWVILALAVGAFFLGFVGLLIAMPVAILLKLLLRVGIERYRASPAFLGPAASDVD